MLKNIPTNIITGALGAGKTTLIQQLLANKPADERWAVLVNEFGEVGIDGAMLAPTADGDSNTSVFIKEVPGGCMCCTSGLPMQIALNFLLARAKPHRLLIEPTGLGHPKEVLQTLMQEHYRDVLNVQATLTLIDARKLENNVWRNHPTFQEQLEIADTIVATKTDLYQSDYSDMLKGYASELGITSTPIIYSEKGKVDVSILKQRSSFRETFNSEKVHHHANKASPSKALQAPPEGTLKIANRGEGYHSRGWLTSANRQFNFERCKQTFSALNAERLKAVIHTDKGVFSFNIVDGDYQERLLEGAADTRIELISSDADVIEQFAERIETELAITDSISAC